MSKEGPVKGCEPQAFGSVKASGQGAGLAKTRATRRRRKEAPAPPVMQCWTQRPLLPGWIQAIDPNTNLPYYFHPPTGRSQWKAPLVPWQPLPLPWIEAIDPTRGIPYYHNPATGTSQWQRPVAETHAPPPTRQTALLPGWMEAVDTNSGRRCYYNSTTGQTSWDAPLISPAASVGPVQAAPAITAPGTVARVLTSQVASLPTRFTTTASSPVQPPPTVTVTTPNHAASVAVKQVPNLPAPSPVQASPALTVTIPNPVASGAANQVPYLPTSTTTASNPVRRPPAGTVITANPAADASQAPNVPTPSRTTASHPEPTSPLVTGTTPNLIASTATSLPMPFAAAASGPNQPALSTSVRTPNPGAPTIAAPVPVPFTTAAIQAANAAAARSLKSPPLVAIVPAKRKANEQVAKAGTALSLHDVSEISWTQEGTEKLVASVADLPLQCTECESLGPVTEEGRCLGCSKNPNTSTSRTLVPNPAPKLPSQPPAKRGRKPKPKPALYTPPLPRASESEAGDGSTDVQLPDEILEMIVKLVATPRPRTTPPTQSEESYWYNLYKSGQDEDFELRIHEALTAQDLANLSMVAKDWKRGVESVGWKTLLSGISQSCPEGSEVRKVAEKTGALATLKAMHATNPTIVATRAAKEYKVKPEEMLEKLKPFKVKRNPHRRSGKMRIYYKKDVLALAIQKHEGACGLRRKLDKCEAMARKRAAKNNGVPKKRRRAQWLIVDTDSDEEPWRNRRFWQNPYDSFDEYNEYEDGMDFW